MLTDRELDARLAGAAGVSDGDLPPLPLDLATLIGQPAPAAEPASVIAARQLVDDARASRTSARPRRRPRRAVLLRAGAAAVAVAAVWAAVVLPADPAVPPDGGTAAPTSPVPTAAPPTIALPTGGIALVAAEAVTFPLSLDPVPPGLTPVILSRSGGVEEQGSGPLTWSADYEQVDGERPGGVGIQVLPDDPRLGGRGWPQEEPDQPGEPDRQDVVDSGVVTVDGQDAAYVQAAYREPGPAQGDLTTALTWQRPDGQWIEVLGSGAYGEDPAALIAVARSIVFRPQPVDLQFGLAPAGWSVTGYQTGDPSVGAYLDVTSDRDPQQLIRLSLIGRQGGLTIDSAIESVASAAPVEPVTVHGLDARLARVPASEGQPEHWVLVGQFVADGPLLQLLAPIELTAEQVVAIADQTSYTP